MNIFDKDIEEEKSNKKADIKIKASVPPIQPPKPNVDYKVEECKVKFIFQNKVYFIFKDNYTLTLPIDKSFDIKAKTIKIAYQGKIGKANFKYWVEK